MSLMKRWLSAQRTGEKNSSPWSISFNLISSSYCSLKYNLCIDVFGKNPEFFNKLGDELLLWIIE